MAKGNVAISVIKTNDDHFLLQVPEPHALPGQQRENNVTVHKDEDALLAAIRQHIRRGLQ